MQATRTVWNGLNTALGYVGNITTLLLDSIRRLPTPPFEWKETIRQMAFIGVASIPVVLLTSCFSGAVLSLYLSKFLMQYHAVAFVGATVGLSATREIGPVIAGITVAARCGSAMAAEIGTMAVTEQIDALEMLSVNPVKYLVVPRVIAAFFMMPILGLLAMYSATIGAYFVAGANGVPGGAFIAGFQQYTHLPDFIGGFIKTPVFGIIIALVACDQGLRCKNGAVGVGKATTHAVVLGIVFVYVADFLLAGLFY